MNESVRSRIEERLRALGMTQRDFAAMLGVSEVTVSRWLSGERNPSIETLSKIADALGTDTSYFFASDSRAEEKSGMGTGLKVTFSVILGLVITAVAAGLLSKGEKDKLVDILKKDDAENSQGGK